MKIRTYFSINKIKDRIVTPSIRMDLIFRYLGSKVPRKDLS